MNFEKTKNYKMPSGMGGSFTLRFLREFDGIFFFKITNPDWEREIRFNAETISKVTLDGVEPHDKY